jgi:dTDP-glucose pyrophosphorylase
MEIKPLLIQPEILILKAISVIDSNRKGIAIVVDQMGRLLGVITDGDVRRAILDRIDLNQPVSALLERRHKELYPVPVAAPVSSSKSERVDLMRQHKIRHLPIVDENGVVVDLSVLDEFVTFRTLDLTAVVMAGGFGKRLRPLTDHMPKPMLPVDGKPLLERIIDQLRETGIRDVNLALHYKPELIKDYFGNGEKFGVSINYIHEKQPLGTAGALGLIETPNQPILIINGDVLTKMDIKSFFDFHLDHKADMTVALREYGFELPYGEIEIQGVDISSVREKPVKRYFLNAGIYLVDPRIMRFIPDDGTPLDMTNFIDILIEKKRRVIGFPIREYWIDIGRIEEYEIANNDCTNGRF